MLVSRDYWIAKGTSGAPAAQNIDHVEPSDQNPYLRYLYVDSSDGLRTAFTLERPAGTVVLAAFTPFYADFGPEGFFVPGADGDTVRLAVAAGAGTAVTRAYMVGVDKPRSH